jgi:hypothetical protein
MAGHHKSQGNWWFSKEANQSELCSPFSCCSDLPLPFMGNLQLCQSRRLIHFTFVPNGKFASVTNFGVCVGDDPRPLSIRRPLGISLCNPIAAHATATATATAIALPAWYLLVLGKKKKKEK